MGYDIDANKYELQLTADGSHTLYLPGMDEHYHSTHGAIQESRHVFIAAGLHQLKKRTIRLLEIGFGTGLNAFLTLLEAEKKALQVQYHTFEPNPLPLHFIEKLNYGALIAADKKDLFVQLHETAWDKPEPITTHFVLHKIKADCHKQAFPEETDLVYFDAFAPDKQPEMWNQALFDKLYAAMSAGGILTTYCAKGSVRRMMKEAGYTVERIPAPPGKREMLRAIKL